MNMAARFQTALGRGAPAQVVLGSVATRVAGSLLGFGATFLATAVLGPEGAGILFGTLAWVAVLVILSLWGALERLLLEVSPLVGTWREKTIPAMINTDLLASIRRAVILLAVMGIALLLLDAAGSSPALSWGLMALMLVVTLVTQVLAATAKGLGQARRSILYEFVVPSSVVLLVAGFAYAGVVPGDFPTIGAAYVAGTVLAGGACFFVLLRPHWHARKFKRARERLRRRDRIFMLIDVSNFLNTWLAMLMLPFLLPSADVGVFNLAFRMAAAVGIVATTIYAVLSPQLARALSARDRQAWQATVRMGHWLMAVLGAGFMAAIYLVGPAVLAWVGEEFLASLTSLYILSACFTLGMALGPGGSVLSAAGREDIVRNANIPITVAALAAMVPMVWTLGITGAAIVAGASYLTLKAVLLLFELRILRGMEWS